MDRATQITNALFGAHSPFSDGGDEVVSPVGASEPRRRSPRGPGSGRHELRRPSPPSSDDEDMDLRGSCENAANAPPAWLREPRPRLWGMPIFLTYCCVNYLCFTTWLFIPSVTDVNERWRQGHSVLANFLVAMSMFSYFSAFYINPTVPLEGEKDRWHAGDAGAWEHGPRKDAEDIASSLCRRCKIVKDNRIHHCRRCLRCVHRYDHHCEWINNCVGQANHQSFLLFILYIACLAYHYWYLLWRYMGIIPSNHISVSYAPLRTLRTVYLQLFTVLVVFLTFFATLFLVWSYYLLFHNATSYDFSVGRLNAYNRGLYRNIAGVMGANPLLWLWPRWQRPVPQENLDR